MMGDVDLFTVMSAMEAAEMIMMAMMFHGRRWACATSRIAASQQHRA
jgi:hypothetical protein